MGASALFTAVLIADPARRPLDGAFASALRNAWGGGPLRWLSPDEAAEFDLPARPDTLAEVQEEADRLGADLLLLPSGGRKKRLLIADMDSTMIGQECIDELADLAGVGAEVAAITARAMNGELDFEGALLARVGLLRGRPESLVARALAERIAENPGARTLVATMRAGGAHAALVSGGFTAFTGPVAARLGFDEHRANVLLAEGGRLTGDVARPILGRDAKVAALGEIAGRLGLTPADALAVGDGANDLGMLAAAGLGVAIHAKPVVAAAAPFCIRHGDLTALLFLQGYGRAEFAA